MHRISVKQRKIEIVKTEMAIKQMSGELASNYQTKKNIICEAASVKTALFPH